MPGEQDESDTGQEPIEETGNCPVCGERYFRKRVKFRRDDPESSGGIELKEPEVPLCVRPVNNTIGLEIFYHA